MRSALPAMCWWWIGGDMKHAALGGAVAYRRVAGVASIIVTEWPDLGELRQRGVPVRARSVAGGQRLYQAGVRHDSAAALRCTRRRDPGRRERGFGPAPDQSSRRHRAITRATRRPRSNGSMLARNPGYHRASAMIKEGQALTPGSSDEIPHA
jgi:hypothetical protein